MWTIIRTDAYARREKWYAKKRPRELAAVERNLLRFARALEAGVPPRPPAFGYLHAEPAGVVAVDQTGGVKLAATRLYTYPDASRRRLYLLTIGDKASQGGDIEDCRRFAAGILADPDVEWEGDHAEGEDEG